MRKTRVPANESNVMAYLVRLDEGMSSIDEKVGDVRAEQERQRGEIRDVMIEQRLIAESNKANALAIAESNRSNKDAIQKIQEKMDSIVPYDVIQGRQAKALIKLGTSTFITALIGAYVARFIPK